MSLNPPTEVQAYIKDELEEKLCILQKENADLQRDFELNQAKFHELILQKDVELNKERENCKKCELKVKEIGEELSSMETEMNKIRSELNGVRTTVAVSETNKQEEIRNIISNYQQEVASLQQLMKETAETTSAKIAAQYESEKHKLVSLNENYEEEIQELRNKLRQEKVSFLSTVAKSIMRVGAIGSISTCTEHENMEESMKKAHEEAQILKSVVVPLESEIRVLKSKLAVTEANLAEALKKNVSEQDISGSKAIPFSGRKSPSLPNLESITDVSEKVEKLFSYLKTEKAARKDLEMYVTVLSTQKSMLQDEIDKVNNELQDVCRLLEDEKQSHEGLKQTWQMANDQFLESQRLMMADLRRMEGVLTTEQQRQITDIRRVTNDVPVKIIYNGLDNHKSASILRQASMPDFSHVRKLQQKDEARKRQEKKVQELDEKRNKQHHDQEERRRLKQTRMAKDKNILQEESLEDNIPHSAMAAHPASDSIPIMVGGHRIKRLSSSSRGTSNSPANSEIGDDFCWKEFDDEITFLNNSPHESLLLEESTESAESMTAVRVSPEKILNLPSLTAAQIKAITDPTPETEANRSLVAGIKLKSDTSSKLNLEGKRLVSEKEWLLLEDEIRASREKLGQSCVMCSNYEAQLQTAQGELKSVKMEVKQLENSLLSEQQINKNLIVCQEELQLALKNSAEDVQSQIIHLTRGLQNCERCVTNFRDQMSTTHQQLEDHCKTLAEDREDVQQELTKLQEENDSLVDKYSKTAQELQAESVNLPNNLEELQLLVLKYREQVILAKVAKEHREQSLESEIVFMKSLVVGEQQEKVTLEETMSQEITALQAKVAELSALGQELKLETELRVQSETNLRKMESSFKSMHIKSKQFIEKMQERIEEIETRKGKLESENHTLRGKVQSLQGDLRNSEAVQRDFVKLSQSLQVQLEKIRQAENEVRWQHEDDIDECNNCKIPFSVTRRKHHCRHCGRIFCADCTTKSVSSGRNFRATKVCDVCHTILVKDATPYFHTEAPVT